MSAPEDLSRRLDRTLQMAGVNPDGPTAPLIRGVLERLAHTALPETNSELATLLEQLAENPRALRESARITELHLAGRG
jgi:hypothetical protein